MDRRITATEAARTFSELLNRVRYRGETFLVERGGTDMCRISPAPASHCTVADLARILKGAPKPDSDYRATVAKLGRRQPPLPKLRWPR